MFVISTEKRKSSFVRSLSFSLKLSVSVCLCYSTFIYGNCRNLISEQIGTDLNREFVILFNESSCKVFYL